MADPKINYVTYDRVLEAVTELKKQGLRVSCATVRTQIGSGSLSTISRFLKDISFTQKSNISPEDYLHQFPDRLKELMRSMYAEIAEAASSATAEERRKIQELEDRLRARWAANVKDKLRVSRRLEVEIKHGVEVRSELKQATQKIWNDQELINDLTARTARAESENSHLRELTVKLEKINDNLKMQIEHFEQHTLQQRRADNQMHLLKITKLEQDLANSQARVMDLSMELAKASKRER
ncbi:Plasmid replication [Pseudomonas fluorescens R124]|jgi:predicted RNase H-like nuclease (RuvC/YqgF family)|uniref:Plasmid replication n=1 Tax=Pseudomonas fluorescens R124 TaxID=743713 RepID=A0A7U9CTB2_PSEFL|nr:DNA-binding protein [Pseudomonas fluorescens]EJZ58206.1 Plasmid replication [Pseudomonas fluorescens R124]